MNEDNFYLGVKAIIRNPKGEILLLKTNPRTLTGNKKKSYWDLPGGRIQKGDTAEKTLKRELKEETGISNIRSLFPFTMVLSNIRIPVKNESVGLVLSSYVCEVGKISKITISDEHTQSKWASPKDCIKLLKFKYPTEFLDNLKDLK